MRLQNAGFSNQPVRAAGEDPYLQEKGFVPSEITGPSASDQSLENWDIGLSRHLGGGAAQRRISARLCLQYPAPIGRALKRATSEAEP